PLLPYLFFPTPPPPPPTLFPYTTLFRSPFILRRLFKPVIAVIIPDRLLWIFAVSPVQLVTALEIIGRKAAGHIVHDVTEQRDGYKCRQCHKYYHHVAEVLSIPGCNCGYGDSCKHQDVEDSRQQQQQEIAHNQTKQATASFEHHVPGNPEFIQCRDHRLIDVGHERKEHVDPHQYIRYIRNDDDQDSEQEQ